MPMLGGLHHRYDLAAWRWTRSVSRMSSGKSLSVDRLQPSTRPLNLSPMSWNAPCVIQKAYPTLPLSVAF